MHVWVNYHSTPLLSANSAEISIPFSLSVNNDKVRHFPFPLCSVDACGIGTSKVL